MVIYNDDDVILLLKKRVFTVNAKPFDNYAPLHLQLPAFSHYVVHIVTVSAFKQTNKLNGNF